MKKLCMILPMALILCFMVGCQDKEAMAELEEMKAQAEIEEQNKELVKRIFEGLNERNADIYQELYAPDYAWYFPSNNPKPLSREEEHGFVKILWDAFPDINWSIEELIAKDDRIIARFIARGTHTGEFQGIPATGNKIEGSGIWIARIENGKIVEARQDYDMLGDMMQLGMELKPKEEK